MREADRTAQKVKVPASKPDDPSSNPGVHGMKGKNQFPKLYDFYTCAIERGGRWRIK